MELDHAEAHGWVVEELTRRRPVAEAMSALIDRCAAARPHPDWDRLRALPYGDLSTLVRWVEDVFCDEPAAEPLRGLWFGLFNPCPDGRNPVADVYVCGSKRFNPDPHDNGWAVGPDWWPDGRYADSAVLADLYRVAYRQGAKVAEQKDALGVDAEYPLALGYAAFAVRELLTRLDPTLFLGESESLGVAVGFDSGDFVLLGELTADGLGPTDPSKKPPDPPFEPVLEALRSADGREVFRALTGLLGFGDRAREAVPDLLRIVATAAEVASRQFGLTMLGVLAADDPRAKEVVFGAFADPSPFVRREALQATIALKGLSSADLARIREMEADPDRDVARWSEIALRNIELRGTMGVHGSS